MTKQAHTPGPWRIEKNRASNGGTYYRIFDTDDAQACIAQVIGDGRIEYHDNAILIAAAPDLLAALRVAIESLQTEGARAYDSTNKLATAHIDRAVEAARAAIAKAEGRQ